MNIILTIGITIKDDYSFTVVLAPSMKLEVLSRQTSWRLNGARTYAEWLKASARKTLLIHNFHVL